MLNGSNSRIYKLAWGDETPMTVIATDGGLLEKPVQKPYVTLGPGERVELWADFSGRKVGDEVTLMSREFLGAEGDSLVGDGMGHGHGYACTAWAGMMAGACASQPAGAPANGRCSERPSASSGRRRKRCGCRPACPAIERYRLEDAEATASSPARSACRCATWQWLLNGRVFEMEGVAENEIVKLGSLEVWEFVNEQNPNEMMERMGMAHPMHIHGVQFQVVQRDVLVPELKAGFDSVREGYVDEGWKDTVVVMPGERVRLLVRFPHAGLFVYHCHNLEHEDLGMMRNYRVDA